MNMTAAWRNAELIRNGRVLVDDENPEHSVDRKLDAGRRMLRALEAICEPVTIAADAETISACQDLHESICEIAMEAISLARSAGIEPAKEG